MPTATSSRTSRLTAFLKWWKRQWQSPHHFPNLIVVDYGEDGASAKSNEDTAYSWRGKWVMYIWSFWTRTDGVPPVGPCVYDIIS